MTGIQLDANAYLGSLGIEVTDPAQSAIGRLALAGEFTLGKARGVILRPKRGGVSDRYLELLAAHDYAFVVVDGGRYPAVYARKGDALAPVRALPIDTPRHFPSEEVFAAWRQLIRSSAGPRGDAAQIGVAQLVACLGNCVAVPERVSPNDDVPLKQIGGTKATVVEPLRTAVALLAGFRLRPSSPGRAGTAHGRRLVASSRQGSIPRPQRSRRAAPAGSPARATSAVGFGRRRGRSRSPARGARICRAVERATCFGSTARSLTARRRARVLRLSAVTLLRTIRRCRRCAAVRFADQWSTRPAIQARQAWRQGASPHRFGAVVHRARACSDA